MILQNNKERLNLNLNLNITRRKDKQISNLQHIDEIYIFIYIINIRMTQIVFINIGGAGVKMGDQFYQKIIRQLNINQPNINQNIIYDNSVFFQSNKQSSILVSRSLFIDTSPQQVNMIRKSKINQFYNKNNLINGKQDTANNCIRGSYTLGRNIIDLSEDQLRKQFEKCHNLSGIIMNLALSGGTGPGLGTKLIQNLNNMIDKKVLMINLLTPSLHMSDTVVQPYNAVFGIGSFFDNNVSGQIINIFDNQKIYNLCETKKNIQNPSYKEVNQYIAEVVCNITNHLRVKNKVHSFSELYQNLVPYKKICYLDPTYVHVEQQARYRCLEYSSLFSSKNSLSSYNSYTNKHLSLAASTFFRGNLSQIQTIYKLNKIKKQLYFPKWLGTGLKVITSNSQQKLFNIQCVSLNNNLTMLHLIKNLSQKYDKLWRTRAFVHWFIGEGIPDEDFRCQRSYLQLLERQYEEISCQNNQGQQQEQYQ